MMRSILKFALPHSFVQLLRDVGRVETGARGSYLRLAWRRLWVRDGADTPLALDSTTTLVMICHGNILRSVFAEALLKEAAVAARLPELRVSSAGLHAVAGRHADPRGVDIARERGLDLSGHRATPLDAKVVAAADLLLAMDYVNAAEILSRYPASAGKVVLLGSFDPACRGDLAIADPFTGDLVGVRSAYSRVAAAVAGLIANLTET